MKGHDECDGLGMWSKNKYIIIDIWGQSYARKYGVARKQAWLVKLEGNDTFECEVGNAKGS